MCLCCLEIPDDDLLKLAVGIAFPFGQKNLIENVNENSMYLQDLLVTLEFKIYI